MAEEAKKPSRLEIVEATIREITHALAEARAHVSELETQLVRHHGRRDEILDQQKAAEDAKTVPTPAPEVVK